MTETRVFTNAEFFKFCTGAGVSVESMLAALKSVDAAIVDSDKVTVLLKPGVDTCISTLAYCEQMRAAYGTN